MPNPSMQLTGAAIPAFLTAGEIYVFEPETLEFVAQALYGRDGRVKMQTADGRTDSGVWGADEDMYWTQYESFRDGQRHHFRLKVVSDGTMQAYFSDGRKAFLQSLKPRPGPEA